MKQKFLGNVREGNKLPEFTKQRKVILIMFALTFVIMLWGIIPFEDLGITFTKQQMRLSKIELRKILRVGVPIALQETTVQISFLVINSIVNGMGLMPSAGYGVAQKLVSFMLLVPASVMQSVSAFVAHNVGAGKHKRAFQGFYTAMLGGGAVGVFMFLFSFFGGELLSSIFASDVEVITQSAAYLKDSARNVF